MTLFQSKSVFSSNITLVFSLCNYIKYICIKYNNVIIIYLFSFKIERNTYMKIDTNIYTYYNMTLYINYYLHKLSLLWRQGFLNYISYIY